MINFTIRFLIFIMFNNQLNCTFNLIGIIKNYNPNYPFLILKVQILINKVITRIMKKTK